MYKKKGKKMPPVLKNLKGDPLYGKTYEEIKKTVKKA